MKAFFYESAMLRGMKVVHVIPIAKGAKGELSYFSLKDYAVGSIVEVPIRNKNVHAIVTRVEDVKDAKTRLRTQQFQVKKIKSREGTSLLHPSFVSAVRKIAAYYACSDSAVYYALTSQKLLAEIAKLNEIESQPFHQSDTKPEKMLLQATRRERVEEYKNIIRSEFAKKKTTILCVPTIQDAEVLEKELSKGIEKYTVSFTSALTKNKLIANWNTVAKEKHPLLIIVTSSFLFVSRGDIGTMLLEREQTASYIGQQKPYLHTRKAVEYIAEASGARLVLADLPLSVDSIYRYQEGIYDEFAPLKKRVPQSVHIRTLDMRELDKKNKEEKKSFLAIHPEAAAIIEDTLEKEERCAVYVARRGLSPITICLDCGNTVKDPITGAPVVLYKGKKENVFVSHASGTVRSAHERCTYCTSWKLQSYGIGIEKVQEELENLFPETPIVTVARDETPTHKKVVSRMEEFYSKKGALLLATEMALPYLSKAVQTSVIVSIDALLSIPEWNSFERVFSIIMKLKENTESHFVLQTRKPEQYVLQHATEGTVSEFYKEELAVRKKFSYPPYGTLIRVTAEGSPKSVEKDMSMVEKEFDADGFGGLSDLMHVGSGKYRMHGYIRIPETEWPRSAVVQKLRSLPLSVSVSVDPTSIL